MNKKTHLRYNLGESDKPLESLKKRKSVRVAEKSAFLRGVRGVYL